MLHIGLLSDTHSYLDKRLLPFFSEVDQIWHAGDIGSVEVLDYLERLKPVKAVFGNIDGNILRNRLSEIKRFECEGVDVLMTHIGGYPGKYDAKIRNIIYSETPKLFISGHSHILKVMNDANLDLLHINPGAAGIFGIHTVQTAVRFTIDKGNIKDLEMLEMKRGAGENLIMT